jgi:cardiolipin synthase (CMP-forming)
LSRYIPNLITSLRLIASPLLAVLLLQNRFQEALATVVVAGVTDGLDGYAARRLNARGQTGVVLDPIADKVMLVTLFVVLAAIGRIPSWLLFLVLVRDLVIVVGAILLRVLRGFRKFVPVTVGKVSTFFQIIFVGFVLLEAAFPHPAVRFLKQVALALTALFTFWSGVLYVRKGCQMAGWIGGGNWADG